MADILTPTFGTTTEALDKFRLVAFLAGIAVGVLVARSL
jgi:hypothetical protein